MLNIPPVGLFITGTDTDIGKTYVSCLIAKALCARGYRVGVYKPVATGGSPADGKCVAADAVALHRAAGLSDSLADVCPQVFQAPLAPPSAAAAEFWDSTNSSSAPVLTRKGSRAASASGGVRV